MFYFTPDCLTGIEILDDEHKNLFDILSQIDTLLKNDYLTDRYDNLKSLLSQLEQYADEHFSHEEAYMESICDSELPHQRAQHLFFKDQVSTYLIRNIDDDNEQRRLLIELTEFLAKWLCRHIIGSDLMIGKLPPLEEWMIRENPCEFVDDFLVGNALIDSEHKILFDICDRAFNMAKQGVDNTDIPKIMEILKELKEYTITHFNDEEEYMQSINYSELSIQQRAHQSFIMKLEQIEQYDFTKKTQEEFERVIEFLLNWLINHILYTDKKITKSIN